jgi:hypothetical protein
MKLGHSPLPVRASWVVLGGALTVALVYDRYRSASEGGGYRFPRGRFGFVSKLAGLEWAHACDNRSRCAGVERGCFDEARPKASLTMIMGAVAGPDVAATPWPLES